MLIAGDIQGMKMPHSNPSGWKNNPQITELHLSQAHRLPSVGLQTEVQMKKNC